MKYESPELRERLAREYVLGTLPRLARRRFERLIAADATLAALVADWAERFAPLDDATPDETPPDRVWQAIEQRIGPAPPPPASARSRLGALAFWRGPAIAAGAVCAALVLYVATLTAPSTPRVLAVLADTSGQPAWIALSARPQEVSVSAIGPVDADAGHSFQLWGIAGGAPKPLGLLRPKANELLLLDAAVVPGAGSTLAVSREPPGGSPTGLPTGPVLYQGKVLITLAEK